MQSLEDENMSAVITHMRNYPLNHFSDNYSSVNFSKGSSSFDSEPESQIDKIKQEEEEKEKAFRADDSPFEEFNSSAQGTHNSLNSRKRA